MKDSLPENDRHAQIKRELIIVLLLAVLVYVLASHYDILEVIVTFANEHETWELDEIIPVALFLVFALAVFSLRRWKDVLRSEKTLKMQNRELQKAFHEIRQLKGIIPICSSCKKIRDDKGYWHQVEVYVRDHSEAEFSHGICPDCLKKLYPEFAKDSSGSGEDASNKSPENRSGNSR